VKISEATALIHTPLIEWARPQSWCDLGCGSGTFTTALAQLLAPGSMIHAVDLDPRALEYVPDHYDRVEIRKTLGDIGSPSLRLPPVDGILMANTLHFIQEQQALMRRLVSVTDSFLIVEYERSKPNRWGTISGGIRKTPPTLHRDRSGTSGETSNTTLAVWWHDVLGSRRTAQNTMLKASESLFSLPRLSRIQLTARNTAP
jgi:SAM-dependent methyltransferase